MEQHYVERDGEPLLVFKGEPLARVREPAASGDPNQWELRLYRTEERGYVLAASFHVMEGGNRRLNTAWSFAALSEFTAFLDLANGAPRGLLAQLLEQAASKDAGLRAHGPRAARPRAPKQTAHA